MAFQKVFRESSNSEERHAVLVQPLPDHSDQEVVDLLESQGATEVTVLTPGFISAETRGSTLSLLEAIARVEPKVKKQLHRR